LLIADWFWIGDWGLGILFGDLLVIDSVIPAARARATRPITE
jgi:hypothetical protein